MLSVKRLVSNLPQSRFLISFICISILFLYSATVKTWPIQCFLCDSLPVFKYSLHSNFQIPIIRCVGAQHNAQGIRRIRRRRTYECRRMLLCSHPVYWFYSIYEYAN